MAFCFVATKQLLLLYCVLVGSIPPALSLPLSGFYPYGSNTRDARAPTNDDGSTGRIPITIPFPFFDEIQSSLFVNTNGVISFSKEVSTFTPNSFPLGNDWRMVAPFWADVDTTRGGVVWYRESKDAGLLARATTDVRKAVLNQPRFTASWLFIATWDNVAFFGSQGIKRQKRNTFQAVLITNGRHSFVIFNYNKIVWTTGTASQGNVDGLGGKPAQAGFNAGDGIRFSMIPGSRTSAILNLPSTSNVAIPGRWMFRIDQAEIKIGGCNVEGSLTLFPSVGNMLGGLNVIVTGPCYDPSTSKLVCNFDIEEGTNGVVINEIRGVCTLPRMRSAGKIILAASINGGSDYNFAGSFTTLPITRAPTLVTRQAELDGSMVEGRAYKITWHYGLLGTSATRVTVEMARYMMRNGRVTFHSFYTLVANQENSGQSQFVVRNGEGEGPAERRYITVIRVKKLEELKPKHSQYQWIWSDVFVWGSSNGASARCFAWFRKQPDPATYTDDPTFLPCPRTRRQAQIDNAKYTPDEYCNSKNAQGCRRYHSGAQSCYRSVNPSDKDAGTQCCYNVQGNLLSGPRGGGSMDRVHVNSGIPVLSHFFHDIVPYYDCCLWSSNCEEYYEKRPSDDGSGYVAPQPALLFGDPHMVTLDGVKYTFNGQGEFTVLKVNNTDFVLQARMLPLTNDRGQPTKATVFTTFAMKARNSDTVQVGLNGRHTIDVRINGNLTEFEEQLLQDFNGVSVQKHENSSKYSVMFSSGISVTIEGQRDLLQLILVVPVSYKGRTSGLLGLWDDDKQKEFLKPDGTFLATSSDMSTIHHQFGLKWATTAADSLFTYAAGKSHASYMNLGYVPIFLDQQNIVFPDKRKENEARAICGSDKQCLFDIHLTEKLDIGRASKMVSNEFEADVKETKKKGCVPISSVLHNGAVSRTDTANGTVYRFSCNQGYVINGPRVKRCTDGIYDDTTPTTCSKKPTTMPTTKATTPAPRRQNCYATGIWKRFPGMNRWCLRNCAKGICPKSRCACPPVLAR